MEQHRLFDDAVEQYEIFNSGTYDRATHIEHVREVMRAGTELLHALGAPTGKSNASELVEATLWSLQYFEAMDNANAQIHCAPVRYSPITFRIARALVAVWPPDEDVTEELARVLQHDGLYEEDAGR